MSSETVPEPPVLFAYDGSELARAAIEQAGTQLRTGRPGLVLTVWQPLESIPFAQFAVIPQEALEATADQALETAREGAELARAAGFDASPLAEAGPSTWQRIVQVADDNDAAIIVLGSHGRSGVRYAAMGSVATAVAHHARHAVMISRRA